jgi:hypothetical protein
MQLNRDSSIVEILTKWLQILIANIRIVVIKSEYNQRIHMDFCSCDIISWLNSVGIILIFYIYDISYIFNVKETIVSQIVQKYRENNQRNMGDELLITDYMPDQQECQSILNSLNLHELIEISDSNIDNIINNLNRNLLPTSKMGNFLSEINDPAVILGMSSISTTKSARK